VIGVAFINGEVLAVTSSILRFVDPTRFFEVLIGCVRACVHRDECIRS
jgi:hypothetical protein